MLWSLERQLMNKMWYLPKHTDTSRKRETFWRFWIVKIHLSVLNYTITQLLWWKYFNSDWSNYLIIRQRSTITNTYQDNMDLRSASQETTQCYRTEQRAQIWPSVLVPAFFSFAFCGLLSRTWGSRTDSRSHANLQKRLQEYNESHKYLTAETHFWRNCRVLEAEPL